MKFSTNQIMMLVAIVFLVSLILVVFDIDKNIITSLTSFCGVCS